MIPLFAITTCNQLDHYEKLINSINFPIQTVSVLVNSNLDYFDEVRKVSETPFVGKFEFSFCPQNMGCAPSWNYHIKHYPTEDYWVLCSDDVQLGKNDLSQIHSLIQNHDGVFGDKDCEYILFALNRNMINNVGLFDENFYPGCYEDNDYRTRISLSNVKTCHFDITALHNDLPAGSPHGCGTASRFSEEKLRLYQGCVQKNGEYFQRKWSTQPEKIDSWVFDIDERAKKEFRI